MDRTWLMSLILVQLFTWFGDLSFRNVVPYVTNNQPRTQGLLALAFVTCSTTLKKQSCGFKQSILLLQLHDNLSHFNSKNAYLDWEASELDSSAMHILLELILNQPPTTTTAFFELAWEGQ